MSEKLIKISLGAHPETLHGKSGYRFSVRSPLASSLKLCLFDNADDNADSEMQYDMQRNGDIWHYWVAGAQSGQRYGFRADGQSTACQPFNPQKLLLDPYGKGVVGKPKLANDDDYALYLMNDERDNASVAPKSQIVDETFGWEDDVAPQTPWAETIVYEMHVKGFTQLHPELPVEQRGTYAALATPEVTSYLKDLGITAVELLPINYGTDEPHLQRKDLTNYWNYNTLSHFSVDSDNWSGQNGTSPLSEFKTAVKALHKVGIEVILDVVFNHTAESEYNYPTHCYRGLANADFYWLEDNGNTVNQTGCGNTVQASHPATQDWIVDCLCYWVEACHVDGFRFDLGTVLGRDPHFNREAELLQRIASEPLLANVKLIFEPWDIDDDGYQLGNFPAPFAEWNDRFRDDMRRFFLLQDGDLSVFAQRFSGSSDIFKHNARLPHSSINAISTHDGFTLADLVAYNNKHNSANCEDNRDGDNHNYSYNHGVEGITDDTAILTSRGYSQRALLSALLLSNGTPMLLAGDELGHSQGGNNNAYCQDNTMAWIDWASADVALQKFTRELIRARRCIASLNGNAWWSNDNVNWLKPDGTPMQVSDWEDGNDASKAMQIRLDNDFLLLINGNQHEQSFALANGVWLDDKQLPQKTVMKTNHLSITLLTQKKPSDD